MKAPSIINKAAIVLALLSMIVASWLVLPACSKELTTTRGTKEESDTGEGLAKADKPTQLRLNYAYGKLSLSFEVNNGQCDSRVQFISHTGAGHTVFLTSTDAVLTLKIPDQPAPADRMLSPTEPDWQSRIAAPSKPSVLRMKLVGANRAPKVAGLDELTGKSNYFIGNDPKKWRAGVSNYAKVQYRSVYPGIDMVYYGDQGRLEYDFNLAPGANPAAIRIGFKGAERIRIDRNGDLVLSVSGREIRQHKPVVYQDLDGIREQIDVRYVMKKFNEVRFALAHYDATKPVVIDPILAYSTYLGGSGDDKGRGIAVDAAGNAYVTGVTQSINFPTTPGAFKTVLGTFGEVFVTKLNAAGTSLVYSSYLGVGESNGIAVDSVGSAYVVGTTGADNFPTTVGAFDTTYNGGGGDAFVTKLSPDGSALEYSTYVGGTNADFGQAIAVDSEANAYITGLTISPGFPIVPGAFQSQLRAFRERSCSGGDAFVSKLNSTCSALLYSTFLGGNRGEAGFGIAVDSAGCAYVTGATDSNDFPTSAGAFQPIHGRCFQFICESCFCEDAFVTKLNDTGTNIVYSSFLGGSVCDVGTGIAIDPSRNAYVTGRTNSFDFPRANPLQPTIGGSNDAFVTKINPTGSSLIYSTFLGGQNNDEGFGIAADAAGNAYVIGQTFFLTPPSGSGDAFVAKLNASGSSQIYFLSLGGSGFESAFAGAIALDGQGKAYVTGSTGSTDFPITLGSVQTTSGGSVDAFVTKIDDIPPFDICVQDDSSGSILQLNSRAGNYQFTTCQGVTVAGTAAIIRKGCLITLQVNGPDRRLQASIDTCRNTGTASMQVFSQGRTFTIQDRNTADNTCRCAGN